MNRTWTFTDLEFVVLWERMRQDFLPAPLTFTSRTPGYYDFLREKADTRDRLRCTGDDSCDEVFEAMASPDIAIEVHGGVGRADPAASIRMLAVRAGERGYLITQRPGETVRHSGGFTVTSCTAVGLGPTVVAALPRVGAGSRADIALVADSDMDYGYRESRVFDTAADSAARRSLDFLDHPMIRCGTVDVVQRRSIFGPRGLTRHRLRWRDLDGDGRYVIDDTRTPVAVPAAADRFTTLIDIRVAAVVRAIKDEVA
ncbi:ESX secretion-associated protein EspG [Nocardia sp. NPDC052566]|uniref:ESX secretion-associated protein EspG n=1 Tax=Nocardia sp. NPDC052566 TaxID=3364330 RepID=UPI0037C93DDC